MTVNEIAIQLLTHFSPEERAIPEAGAYPGRHGAVLGAINGALQEIFAKGQPWVRFEERGVILHPPATVGIQVTHDSTSAVIAEADWQAWFAGCVIRVDGSAVENRIKNAARTVLLKFPWDGETTPVATNQMIVTGTLSPNVTGTYDYTEDQNGKPRYEKSPTSYIAWEPIELPGNSNWVITDGLSTNLFYSAQDVATPDLVTSWSEWGAATGTATVNDSISYGDIDATIYHTSVELATDVLRIVGPVKIDGVELPPGVTPDRRAVRNYDFGSGNYIGADTRFPAYYKVESWSPSATTAPANRIVLSHYPEKEMFLEYSAMIGPPTITSLAAASSPELPIPAQFIDSVFMPIARQRLSASEFFRAGNNGAEIQRAYADALRTLASIGARTNAGTRIVPVY